MSIVYRQLHAEKIDPALFTGFDRYQEVKRCWRKEEGQWVLKDMAFTEQWGEEDFRRMAEDMQQTAQQDGAVFAAFDGIRMVGIASVGGQRFGSRWQYIELCSIHVTYGHRREGIGEKLFELCACVAAEKGAEKLYISAQSSEETIAFYKAMGCTEAEEYSAALVSLEPYDCQLEYTVPDSEL